jgi:hypothetical protein
MDEVTICWRAGKMGKMSNVYRFVGWTASKRKAGKEVAQEGKITHSL